MGCNSCKDRVARAAAKAAHGLIGIARAAFTRSTLAPDVFETRKAICSACDKTRPSTRPLRAIAICTECSCLLAAKMPLAEEKCPLNKW